MDTPALRQVRDALVAVEATLDVTDRAIKTAAANGDERTETAWQIVELQKANAAVFVAVRALLDEVTSIRGRLDALDPATRPPRGKASDRRRAE